MPRKPIGAQRERGFSSRFVLFSLTVVVFTFSLFSHTDAVVVVLYLYSFGALWNSG